MRFHRILGGGHSVAAPFATLEAPKHVTIGVMHCQTGMMHVLFATFEAIPTGNMRMVLLEMCRQKIPETFEG